jgi:hypothetical protein
MLGDERGEGARPAAGRGRHPGAAAVPLEGGEHALARGAGPAMPLAVVPFVLAGVRVTRPDQVA